MPRKSKKDWKANIADEDSDDDGKNNNNNDDDNNDDDDSDDDRIALSIEDIHKLRVSLDLELGMRRVFDSIAENAIEEQIEEQIAGWDDALWSKMEKNTDKIAI